ncbi:MAG: endonuclease/exonuclease/phosphatase family protein [Bifidobacteriaceae bacterium]|jgi:exodeoxyribonuclease-3|nr:endonuclease/exonuclease/phosphatase family protein [Bifidobacteriaceae bacterium]
MALEITSLNVGGIRAAMRKGMASWLKAASPDVLCLQEVRAPASVLASLLPERANHQAVSLLKGRSGVAVCSLLPVARTRVGLPGLEALDTHTGRWVEADIVLPGEAGLLTVVSAYVHSGEAGTERQGHKIDFLQAMTERLAELGQRSRAADGVETVVCGDLNVAHREADLKNWRGNRQNSGFLPEERAILTRWLVELGWIDLGRALAGERDGPYTWWSWRGKAFDNDTGWRIDYQLATPGLAAKAIDFRIDKPERYDSRWTDHAPFTVSYDLPGFQPG